MTPFPTLSRDHRHVRHARLRIPSGAPRHTLVSNIEEALRLCSLPGENEGRTYYFRHLRLSGLPGHGPRTVWLEAFQHALLELAGQAVHGDDGMAPAANAVFFRSQQEACESLLTLIARGQPADAWFWAAVSGLDCATEPEEMVVGLIHKLSRSDASWMAVAAVVFAVSDPIRLLGLLPVPVLQDWLSELGGDYAPPPSPVPLNLRGASWKAVERAAALFGREDPRVEWLASLAVILACPAEMESGAAVHHARSGLLRLQSAETVNDAGLLSLVPTRAAEPGTSAVSRSSVDAVAEARSADQMDASGSQTPDVNLDSQPPLADERRPAPPVAESSPGGFPESIPLAKVRCIGERTAGAGLYFLVNAMRYLHIADTGLGPHFMARFFQHVAQRAGIEASDPILLWTHVTLAEYGPVEVDRRALRTWLRKVRRWCWRNGRISLAEIVQRTGVVTLTRTDLDVSLSLDSADIRIRRIGLDIDPGWLSWFGRVVRFHYLDRGEFS
jgi:hypothetical protein